MGQQSSQPAASTMPEEGREVSVSSDRINPAMKKRKRKGKALKNQSHGVDEEESARLLMSLRDGEERDTNGPDADDVAASAQLIAESSPIRLPTKTKLKGRVSKTKNWTDGKRAAAKGQPKRRSRRGRASPEQLPNPQADAVNGVDDQGEENGLAGTLEEDVGGLESPVFASKQSKLPPSALRLDDIDSEDESVASFLREYEEAGQVPDEADGLETAVQGDEVATKDLSNTLLDHEPESSVYTKYQLPSAIDRPCTSKHDNSRRKRGNKTLSEPTIINSDDDGQALADGNKHIVLGGEPRRSQDFEIIAHAALHHIDQDMNIDPALRNHKSKYKRKSNPETLNGNAPNGSSNIPKGIGKSFISPKSRKLQKELKTLAMLMLTTIPLARLQNVFQSDLPRKRFVCATNGKRGQQRPFGGRQSSFSN